MPRPTATVIIGALWLSLARIVFAADVPAASEFRFETAPTISGENPDSDALVATIGDFWRDYLRADAPRFLRHFAPNAIRMSARASTRQVGRSAIGAGLPAEWAAFERARNRIAERLTVEHAQLHFDGDTATAVYWLEVRGGVRWEYTDQGLVFQAFVRQGEQWQVAHHTDAWSLNYDIDAQQPGDSAAIAFDFAYPVNDLARAVAFYTPLLGPPESSTRTRAVFNVQGARFILDTATWGGAARVREALPNGYAVFAVDDLDAATGAIAEASEIGELQRIATDTYRVGFDADENLFVIRALDRHADTGAAPAISGFSPHSVVERAVQRLMRAWLEMDSETIAAMYAANGTWFDDTRVKERGQEQGAERIAAALEERYWPHYDHTDEGMMADLQASSLHTRSIGTQRLVSYQMMLTGRGPHPFRSSAWVSQVLNENGQVAHTFIVDDNRSRSLVLELDYTGYPVVDLDRARQFYSASMRFGEGYPDDAYYGFWSDHAVFGLYLADPDEDGLPRPHRANGYMSFWVRSAEETYAYLRQQGSRFPTIPAINRKPGIDVQPGYSQVVATDSEGNLIVFSEYSGRPR